MHAQPQPHREQRYQQGDLGHDLQRGRMIAIRHVAPDQAKPPRPEPDAEQQVERRRRQRQPLYLRTDQAHGDEQRADDPCPGAEQGVPPVASLH